MKYQVLPTALTLGIFFAGCDVQSDITKKSLEKYQPTPTPERIVTSEEPIDPADVLEVDTSANGPTLSVNTPKDKKDLNCNKFNRVMINADDQEIKVKGGCSRIMVNGRGNRITVVAAAEIVTYGQNNTIEYSKYISGKRPVVTDSNGTNTVTQVASADADAKPADKKR